MNKKRIIEAVIFTSWCLFILWITLLSRTPKTERVFRPDFLYEIRLFVTGHETGPHYMDLFLKNIILFVPFGFLMPWDINWKKALFIGLLASGFIELIQYVTMLGECEVDDVIANTCGTVIGFYLYEIVHGPYIRWRTRNGKA